MKFKHVRERELGYQRRIEELEDALQHILLACEASQASARRMQEQIGEEGEAVEVIINKCHQVLTYDK